ncbi:SIMPL domain-containing protein [Vallitalea okinawensis]|uniref:SIMPL domain-containing protein n=1 Tax=Vallitalea okinawensis TaxID=2078660 RepID=UPI000CFD7212|nr:SIMPL domain-containing protein [Vallitalea okinawensis]
MGKSINVVGTGTNIAKLNKMILLFDIVNYNEDPLEAKNSNEVLIEAAKDYLNNFGIQEKDIDYSRNELAAIYDKSGLIDTFKAATNFKIQFYDLQVLAEFLYNIEGRHVIVKDIIFTLKDPIYYYDLALKNAVTNADNKASVIANKLGVYIEATAQELTEMTDAYDQTPWISGSNNNLDPKTVESTITFYATVKAKYLVVD